MLVTFQTRKKETGVTFLCDFKVDMTLYKNILLYKKLRKSIEKNRC